MTDIDWRHTDYARHQRERKAALLAEFIDDHRISGIPDLGADRRFIERSAGLRHCSDETWARVGELLEERRQ